MYDHRLKCVFHSFVIPSFRRAIHALVIVVIKTDRTFRRQLYIQTAIIQCQDPAYFSLGRVGYHAYVEPTRDLPTVRHLAVRYHHPALFRDFLPSPLGVRGIVNGSEREGFAGGEY